MALRPSYSASRTALRDFHGRFFRGIHLYTDVGARDDLYTYMCGKGGRRNTGLPAPTRVDAMGRSWPRAVKPMVA